MEQLVQNFHAANLLPVELYRTGVLVIGIATMLLTCIRAMTKGS